MRREPAETDFEDFAASAMPKLRSVAYAWCRDWHHSDDLVQDTMERVYAAWPRVRRGGEEYAYARTTLLRRLISENRRAWRKHEVVDSNDGVGENSSIHPHAPNETTTVEEQVDVLNLLAVLPPRQRAVAILRFIEGLSVSEVADLLSCSEGTIKSQTHHARRVLSRSLAKLK